jgi:hypothetical protein
MWYPKLYTLKLKGCLVGRWKVFRYYIGCFLGRQKNFQILIKKTNYSLRIVFNSRSVAGVACAKWSRRGLGAQFSTRLPLARTRAARPSASLASPRYLPKIWKLRQPALHAKTQATVEQKLRLPALEHGSSGLRTRRLGQPSYDSLM